MPALYLQVFYYGKWVGKVDAVSTEDGGLDLADIIIVDRRLRGRGVGSEMMKCLIAVSEDQAGNHSILLKLNG